MALLIPGSGIVDSSANTLIPGAGTVASSGLNLTGTSVFVNSNSLAYQHAIALNLTPDLFVNANSLAYQHDVRYVQTLSPDLYSNSTTFYAHTLYNQYPDPSEVLIGVQYGVPGLVLTGTNESAFDGSLKLDVVSGKMVKLLTNKVALTL